MIATKRFLAVLALLGTVLAGPVAALPVFDTNLASPNSNSNTPAVYYGYQNQNAGWTVNTVGGTELGLTAILRLIGPAPEVGDNYTVPLGMDSSMRAFWDYSFSIDTQPNGVGGATLAGYTYSITLTDLTNSAVMPNTFNPLAIGDNTYFTPPGTVGASSSASSGAQNAENFSFAGVGLAGYDPNSSDAYQITLQEFAFGGGALVNSDTILVNDPTPQVPEIAAGYSTLPIAFAVASLMLVGDSRRRYRRAR